MHPYVELSLAWILKNSKSHEDKCFSTYPAFSSCKEPTIPVASPDCGETNATMNKEYIAEGARMPTLEWEVPPNLAGNVKEWLVVAEDPDAPLPTPIAHASVESYPRVGPEICISRLTFMNVESSPVLRRIKRK
jgi:hypothetical protein